VSSDFMKMKCLYVSLSQKPVFEGIVSDIGCCSTQPTHPHMRFLEFFDKQTYKNKTEWLDTKNKYASAADTIPEANQERGRRKIPASYVNCIFYVCVISAPKKGGKVCQMFSIENLLALI